MSRVQRVPATFTDSNGQEAAGYAEQTVFDLPTCSAQIVGAAPAYAGDTFVVAVTGTTDPDAGPGVAAVEGGVDNGDGTFTVTAV